MSCGAGIPATQCRVAVVHPGSGAAARPRILCNTAEKVAAAASPKGPKRKGAWQMPRPPKIRTNGSTEPLTARPLPP